MQCKFIRQGEGGIKNVWRSSEGEDSNTAGRRTGSWRLKPRLWALRATTPACAGSCANHPICGGATCRARSIASVQSPLDAVRYRRYLEAVSQHWQGELV